MKENEDKNKWRDIPYSWIEKLTLIKCLQYPKFNEILIKIAMAKNGEKISMAIVHR